MAALFAFLHHISAFVIFAALVVEFVLLRNELTAASAKTIQRADLLFGIAAGVILAVGFLRVYYFEKGDAYYFHSAPFIAKLSIFLIVGLLSILPTVEFLSWRKATKQGQAPVVAAKRMRLIRMLVHAELAGLLLIILCAAMMAKAIGYFG